MAVIKKNEPYMVDDLVVYFTSDTEALVTDYDCRYELNTSLDGCDCCTYRFRSRRDPGFQCRHIKAVRAVLLGGRGQEPRDR